MSCQSVQFYTKSKCKHFWKVYHQCVKSYVKRYNIKLVLELHVRISWLYFFKAYISILQTSSKDSKWWANIHGAKKHGAGD
jgi:hypothetical protein